MHMHTYIWRCPFSIRRLRLYKSPTRVTCYSPWALVDQALVGSPGPLCPCGPGPCGHPWALVGSCGPPWALVGQALVAPPWALVPPPKR